MLRPNCSDQRTERSKKANFFAGTCTENEPDNIFFFPKGKASIREVRKDPAAFKMMMTLTGGSTRANTLFIICLQSSDKF